MKLQRESIKLGSEYRGKWQFCILDNNPEELERVEEILCEMETDSVRGDGHVYTWSDYCDHCPCYEDGYGSGFWIHAEDVEEFKEAWKLAKTKARKIK